MAAYPFQIIVFPGFFILPSVFNPPAFFQAVNGENPLFSSWAADGILVAEEADLLHGFGCGDSINPLNFHNILRVFRIIFRVELFALKRKLSHWRQSVVIVDNHVFRLLYCVCDNTDADIASMWDINPDAITGRQQI